MKGTHTQILGSVWLSPLSYATHSAYFPDIASRCVSSCSPRRVGQRRQTSGL